MTKLSKRLANLKNKASELEDELREQTANMYVITPATSLADERHQPPPPRLWGNYWYTGDICYMFAGQNKGKSILAVQIADAIARGGTVAGFVNETPAQPVLYFDYELTKKQFMNRYISEADRDNYHEFHPNFMRVEINYPKAQSAKAVAQLLLLGLRQCVESSKAKVIVVDNLTRIAGDIAEGGAAFEVMSYLDILKKECGYSILVIGHSKKGEEDKYGISANNALGSSLVMNFMDSSVAIGANAANPGARYVKHLKARNGSVTEAVSIFEIEKVNDKFLSFCYRGVATEAEQMRAATDDERDQITDAVLSRVAANPAASFNAIARTINESGEFPKIKIYHTTVARIVAKAKQQAEDAIAMREAETEEGGDQIPF
jgi:archaellum biogenesis ATPase FlaH